MTYNLKISPSRIRTENPMCLEKMVQFREGYLVNWNWVLGLEVHKGKYRSYRYPHFDILPVISKSYKVEKGIVHLTQGVLQDIFKISEK